MYHLSKQKSAFSFCLHTRTRRGVAVGSLDLTTASADD